MSSASASTGMRLCRACRTHLHTSLIQQRTFARTSRNQKSIPSFPPTSSPELDSILSNLRTKVFIPEIVPEAQRKLIYRPARQALLINDPGVFYTTSDGEEIRLMPMDVRDRPPKQATLHQIIQLMSTREDWLNLPNLLEGLKASKQAPEKLGWWSKMIRKAGEAGHVDIVLRCAEMEKKTGVYLTMPTVVREIVATIHKDAAAAQWTGEGLDRQIQLAQRLVRGMEASERDPQEGEVDYKQSPEVAGLLLELHAVKALNDLDGKDEGNHVLDYSRKIVALWEFGDYSIDTISPTWTLSFLLPMWNGVRKALEVKGISQTQTGAQLRERFEQIQKVISQAREACIEEAQGKSRRGLQMYDALV